MNTFDFLFDLERQIHAAELRTDAQGVSALLDDDFFEFGNSGTVWTREQILADLPQASENMRIESFDYRATPLGADSVLVTYVSRRTVGPAAPVDFLRSSIWRKGPLGWRMVFHQGTTKALP